MAERVLHQEKPDIGRKVLRPTASGWRVDWLELRRLRPARKDINDSSEDELSVLMWGGARERYQRGDAWAERTLEDWTAAELAQAAEWWPHPNNPWCRELARRGGR